jgi:hypothetical protein
MLKFVKNVKWDTKPLSDDEINRNFCDAINTPVDPGLQELCKKLYLN